MSSSERTSHSVTSGLETVSASSRTFFSIRSPWYVNASCAPLVGQAARDRPRDRPLVGDAEDEPALAFERFMHGDPTADTLDLACASCGRHRRRRPASARRCGAQLASATDCVLVGRREDRLERPTRDRRRGEAATSPTARRSSGWLRAFASVTRDRAPRQQRRGSRGAGTSSTSTRSGSRSYPDELPRRRSGACSRSCPRSSRGASHLVNVVSVAGDVADRAVLGLEARAARLLALGGP